jgi:uncharacterized membrane protein
MSVERERGAATITAAKGPSTAVADTAAANGVPEQPGAAATTRRQTAEREAVVVVDVPPGTAAPETSAAHPTRAGLRDIHVVANLHELVAATPLAASEEDALARERRDLNEVVHGVLIIGLAISTSLMLVGVGLAILYGRDLPTTVPDVGDVLDRVFALRPSGFVALGLLVLIATPILRVVGSIGAFLYERDWRFAAITSLVLAILIVSLLLGRG